MPHLIVFLGTRWRWMVSFTPGRLTSEERISFACWIRDCVGPRAVLEALEEGKAFYLDRPACDLVAIPTELFCFPLPCFVAIDTTLQRKAVKGGDEYSGFWDLTPYRLVFGDMAQVLTASMFRVVEECQSTRRRIIAECNLHWLYHSENVKNSRGRDVHIHESSEVSNAYYTTGCSNTRASEN